MIIGVLLAAGRGRRMGGVKQFHPWPTADGTKPLVAAAFDAVDVVCGEMIVVLGHRADEVAGLLEGRSFQAVHSDPDAPMFESIRAGLRSARELDAKATVLLHPADHPEVARATLDRLVAAARKNDQRAVMPEHGGKGGHPVLIPPAVVEKVMDADCPGGLRQFWIDHPELCERITVDDPSTIRDVDSL